MNWTYGITTVPFRREDTLPRTIKSFKAAGFDKPRLFVDGAKDVESWEDEFNLDVSCRYPALKTAGNWVLSLHELYLRSPNADRFMIIQDDVICIPNLKQYLEKLHYPAQGYCNLYTYDSNLPFVGNNDGGWIKPLRQGKGALCLLFSQEAVRALLGSQHLIERIKPTGIDGGIVTAMDKAGFAEYVHNPSLVQHIGIISSIGHASRVPCSTFPGEDKIL